ncbi:MAG: hypothetical protein AB8G05_26285 [Oligoflexales bacterium]
MRVLFFILLLLLNNLAFSSSHHKVDHKFKNLTLSDIFTTINKYFEKRKIDFWLMENGIIKFPASTSDSDFMVKIKHKNKSKITIDIDTFNREQAKKIKKNLLMLLKIMDLDHISTEKADIEIPISSLKEFIKTLSLISKKYEGSTTKKHNIERLSYTSQNTTLEIFMYKLSDKPNTIGLILNQVGPDLENLSALRKDIEEASELFDIDLNIDCCE